MTTYPRRYALQRADMIGWELLENATPERAEGIAVLRHHRTRMRAELCCNPTDNPQFSDAWWLDDGQDQIVLLGTPNLVSA